MALLQSLDIDPFQRLLNRYFTVKVRQYPEEFLGPRKTVIATTFGDDGKILDYFIEPETKHQWVKILRFRDMAQGWTRLSHVDLPRDPIGYPFIAARTIGQESINIVTGEVSSIKKDATGKIIGHRIGGKGLEEVKIETCSYICWVPLNLIIPGARLVGDIHCTVTIPPYLESSNDWSIIWNKFQDKEQDLLVFRQDVPVQVWWTGEGKYEIPLLPGLGPFHLPSIKELGLEVGSYVYPVVEIKTKSVYHPRSWARVPEVGLYDDHNAAGFLAIKIQWKLWNQKWKETYLSGRRQPRFHKEQGTALEDYVTASALYRHLLRRYSDGIWGSYHEPLKEPPYLRRLDFSFAEQRFSIHESKRFVTTLRLPKYNSEEEVRDALDRRGPRRIGGKRGMVDSSAPTAKGDIRWECDACVLNKEACVKAANSTNCTACDLFVRPCTWTRLEDLRNNEPLIRALTFLPPNPNVAEDVDLLPILDMYEDYLQGKYPEEPANSSIVNYLQEM